VALVEALETVSQDRLTHMLRADWSGPRLLASALRTRCMWERGDLRLDDTGIPKPCATPIERRAWVFSSQERQPVYGLSLVLRVGTNGPSRVPLGLRLWRHSGPAKYELALEWRSYARHRLHGYPASGLFDAWYPSTRLLTRIRDDGGDFGCRLRKNRHFNGQPRRGTPAVSGALTQRGRHPCLHRSTGADRLSSLLGAGATASSERLPGRLLRAGAGTPGARAEH
jgi:hypothetical protein